MGVWPTHAPDTVRVRHDIPGRMIRNGRPLKFAIEIHCYVAQTDAFGPEWMIGFNVVPVVENVLASWMGLSR